MERAIRRERETAAVYSAIGKQGGGKVASARSAEHRRRAAQMRREYEAFSKEHELAYYPERLRAKSAQDKEDSLTKEAQGGIIVTGSVEDNFNRKAQITEYTDDLAKTNPNYSTKEFKGLNNCQRCVPTYEMRRRGYNVTAKPQPYSDTKNDELAVNPWCMWKNPKIFSYKTRQDIETAMQKMGDGARVEISIVWEKNGAGHVFCAEQINGRTVFVDPQTGNGDCSNYFELMKKGSYRFWRIDNLRPSDLMIDCCE